MWRKELGEERKEKMKLKDKLEKNNIEKQSKSDKEKHREKVITSEHEVKTDPASTIIKAAKPEQPSPSTLNKTWAKPNNSEYENIELEDKEEGFIGPRLPRMMTDEEFKVFCQKLLGDNHV